MSNKHTIQAFDPLTVPLRGSNLIEASAGTGKTYSIAILVLRLVLEKKIPIQEILMVTFTKAAVAELETRIRQFMRTALKCSQGMAVEDESITRVVSSAMLSKADGAADPERLLKEAVLFLDETSILTIHSFCQRVLTEFAFETRQVFGSEILIDHKPVLTDQVNIFWRQHITTLQTYLLQELIAVGLEREKIAMVVENAMSGKALLQAHELPADFLSDAHQAALIDRIKGFEERAEQVRTAILEYMSGHWVEISKATQQNKYAQKNLGHLLADPALMLEGIIELRDKSNVQKTYPGIVEECKKIILVEEEKTLFLTRLMSDLYNFAVKTVSVGIENSKQQKNQLGFDDLITNLHGALFANRNEFLIKSLQAKYKAAFIDEFQDTDKLQYEIFQTLFGTAGILFYIGDPKQSIYAWRKADIFTYFKAAAEVDNRFGMNTNYRSSKRYIDAMNRFFLPDPGFDTFLFPAESNAISYLNVMAPAGTRKGEFYKSGRADAPITIFENPNNETITHCVVAQIIRLMSSDDFSIEENGRRRKPRPSDIGILVRKNKQAALIKRLLSKHCIPAITIDDTKILDSGEARLVLYILEAVTDVNAPGINKALLSPLTGYTAADILALDDEVSLSRFKEYQHLWEHEGVYVMLAKFIADYHVKQVLLNETGENGERIITNLLQLMELLHKAQVQRQFSPLELIDWFKRGIEGMAVEGDEFVQRVESDEESVKIVTVHKSKGLEYNIVFAPFLDLLPDKDAEFVTFRDPDSGDYWFSERSLLSTEQQQLTKTQVEQENRRLLYVAVTRAVYKCYINKNTNGRYAGSTLAPFVSILMQLPSPLVAIEEAPELPEYYRYTDTAEQFTPAYLRAENFQLFQPNWRKLSYTYLDPEHALVFRIAPATIMNDYDQFVFRSLKRGTQTGNLLHHIFERIDFMDPAYWERIVEDALARHIAGKAIGYQENLPMLLHHVVNTPIQSGGSTFCLRNIPKQKRIAELEFDFMVHRFDVSTLTSLSTPGFPIHARYSAELEGIMNGKIDLFFEHEGRYFILDWKSNYLGNTKEDYSPENLALAMEESNYHLQYLIYTVAVKKYLRLKLPGFDYNRHFGGVIYMFVRGIREGGGHGIFVRRPDKEFIDRLEQILSASLATSFTSF